jgi:hypothetical protein
MNAPRMGNSTFILLKQTGLLLADNVRFASFFG